MPPIVQRAVAQSQANAQGGLERVPEVGTSRASRRTPVPVTDALPVDQSAPESPAQESRTSTTPAPPRHPADTGPSRAWATACSTRSRRAATRSTSARVTRACWVALRGTSLTKVVLMKRSFSGEWPHDGSVVDEGDSLVRFVIEHQRYEDAVVEPDPAGPR